MSMMFSSGNDLEIQLREALDGAQYLRTLFPDLFKEESTGVIEVKQLPKYIPKPGEKMEDSLQSVTTNEAAQNLAAKMLNVSSTSLAAPGQKVFWELRETIMAFGQAWDANEHALIVQDSDDASVISIRVSSYLTTTTNESLVFIFFSF